MTHRAGQICSRIAQLLSASSSLVGVSIFTDLTYSLSEQASELPAITVNEGDDVPDSDEGNDNLAFIDSQTSFEIAAYAVGIDEPTVKAALRELRRVIHMVLMADPTLGLSFVIATKYGGAEQASMSVAGEQCAGSLVSNWRVQYRMNFLDPG